GDVNQEAVNVLSQFVQLLQRPGRPDNNTQPSVQNQPSTSGQNARASGNAQSSNIIPNASPAASSSHRIPSSVAQAASAPNHSVEEHRRLFSRQSGGKLLSEEDVHQQEKGAMETPSCSEKLELHQNGLGEKRVSFPVSASAAGVKDLLHETYPQLRQTGGFQFLVSQEKARKQLKVVSHGSCSVEQIRCFGSGRIYIRPLQRSIPLTEGLQDEDLPLGIGERSEVPDDRQTIDGDEQRSVRHSSTSTEHAADTRIGNMQTAHLPDGVASENVADDNGPDSTDAEPSTTDVTNRAENMKEDDEPVHVLRTFVCHFLRGRPLDVQDLTRVLEGETAEIFVSRATLFEDGMDELLGGMGHDPSLPLEVTFTGECARDLGGPRKELLGAMVREIKDCLFVDNGDSTYILREDVVAENRRHYFGAGLVFGYSILQGGPLPSFMQENLLSKLFGDTDGQVLSCAEEQVRDSFSRFGLVELIQKRPSLMYLLRRTACHPLTYPRMVRLFTPRFSEEGSNVRLKEERTYRLYLNYLKEVAAARREHVTLSSILKFATCSEDEPILGFAIQPACASVTACCHAFRHVTPASTNCYWQSVKLFPRTKKRCLPNLIWLFPVNISDWCDGQKIQRQEFR
ncbi:G2 M phase-specific E3 ubiquitin- ligase, partial [Paramuricea clavata]